jgi:hypothetical protein
MATERPSKGWTGTGPSPKEKRLWMGRAKAAWQAHYVLGAVLGVIGIVILWIKNA